MAGNSTLATIELSELKLRFEREDDPLVDRAYLIVENGVSLNVVIVPIREYERLTNLAGNL